MVVVNPGNTAPPRSGTIGINLGLDSFVISFPLLLRITVD
jgi:hypothetical protein